ncbi:hypothetical protein [Singulisphaera sp. PoT]|uniref:hypothetical protein n=1 Tax=Singulisphaera sp. PoT TaxID=3411797 RepID=UPI003BF4AAC4
MLKPFALSLSLALALGASSVSMAGGLFHGTSGCTTCGLASAQGPAPSAQAPVVASAQSECGYAAPKKCSLFSGFQGFHFKKPHLFDVQYEWVLKKKLVWAHKGGCGTGCGTGGCAPSILPSSQSVASPQAYPTSQSVIPTSQAFYGSSAPSYASTPVYSAPAAPSVAAAGDEAPPAPAATEPPPAPAAPAPSIPAPNAPQTSLLFSTPSSN